MPVHLRPLLAAATVAAAVLVTPAAPSGAEDALTLRATVGPGFTITLKNLDGTVVKHLDVGTYAVEVEDEADAHNFHLRGPGVDQATGVETTGTVTWTVTLTDGSYTYRCDAHPTLMKGSFTVGSVTAPPPKPKPKALPKLVGSVGASSISLTTPSGARVKRLKAGVYALVVHDRSKLQNFHLSGPGVARKTTLRFVGSRTWKLRLRAGTYAYRSDALARPRGRFTVG